LSRSGHHVAESLRDEIAFINSRHGEEGNSENDDAGDDVETGKGSLEELLGAWLPDWLKRLLKVLNQILKLVS
jgi:hypothetical protein